MRCFNGLLIRMAILFSFIVSLSTPAADVVPLRVTGNIVATPCEISHDGISKAVDLGRGKQILSSTLRAPGATTEWVDFEITVHDCPQGVTLSTLTLYGPAGSASPGDMYQNMGSATDILVQLQSQTGEPLGNGKVMVGNIINNAYTYKLRARVYTPTGDVSPGSISTIVTTTFVYQ